MVDISRRRFLQGMGFICLVGPIGIGRVRGGSSCPVCGAGIAHGHSHTEGWHSGTYCPNCGIEIYLYVWDLDDDIHARPFPFNRCPQTGTKNKFWNCRQVPFPHRDLVTETRKATAVLSKIRF